jgi:hypothetical protein
MKYIHKKTKAIAYQSDLNPDTYVFIMPDKNMYAIPREIIEISNDWEEYNHTPENIKQLMDVPCLSINEIAMVYKTANREHHKSEWGLDDNARKLVKMVLEKVMGENIEIGLAEGKITTESSKTELPLYPKIITLRERQDHSFKYRVQTFVKPDSAPEGVYLLVERITIHKPAVTALFSEVVEKDKTSFISEGCQIINTIYDERKPGPWLCTETYIKQHVQRLINLSQNNNFQFQII